MRLLTLRILSLFPTAASTPLPDDEAEDDENARAGVFELCLKSEEQEATLNNYRYSGDSHLQVHSSQACISLLAGACWALSVVYLELKFCTRSTNPCADGLCNTSSLLPSRECQLHNAAPGILRIQLEYCNFIIRLWNGENAYIEHLTPVFLLCCGIISRVTFYLSFSWICRKFCREKLRLLRHLDYDLVNQHLPADGTLDDVPLLYLSAVLYVNFSMLWPETLKLIESHGKSLPKTKLWSCYGDIIAVSSERCVGKWPSDLSWAILKVEM